MQINSVTLLPRITQAQQDVAILRTGIQRHSTGTCQSGLIGTNVTSYNIELEGEENWGSDSYTTLPTLLPLTIQLIPRKPPPFYRV